MKLSEVIRRAAGGELLAPDELEVLKNFRPDEELRQELDSMRSRSEAVAAERDKLAAELNCMRNSQLFGELAGRYGFSDPEYLAFRFGKLGIAPDSAEAGDVMESLKNECPRLFKIDIQPGIPAVSSAAAAAGSVFGADELSAMLANAPELY